MAFHMHGEPNWPAVSYLSLDRSCMAGPLARASGLAVAPHLHKGAAFCLAGWKRFATRHRRAAAAPSGRADGPHRRLDATRRARLDTCSGRKGRRAARRRLQGGERPCFRSPGQGFINAVRHVPPANQFRSLALLFGRRAAPDCFGSPAIESPAEVERLFPDAKCLWSGWRFVFRGAPLRAYRHISLPDMTYAEALHLSVPRPPFRDEAWFGTDARRWPARWLDRRKASLHPSRRHEREGLDRRLFAESCLPAAGRQVGL